MEVLQSWCHGYEKKPLFFIDKDTVCHQCGNNVKLHLDGENVVSRDLSHSLRNVGHIAVHSFYHQIAVCETDVLQPTIQIFSADTFETVGNLLKGTAELEITSIAFSASDFLYVISGVPDFQLVIWDFKKEKLLLKTDIMELVPSCLSISPLNWRQAVLVQNSIVSVFEVERCADLHIINSKSFHLPAANSEVGTTEHIDLPASRLPTRSSTAGNSRGLIEPPIDVVAGVASAFSKDYAFFKDESTVKRMRGLSVVWSDVERDFYIGCDDGCLVKYDDDREIMRVLHNSLQIERMSMSNVIHEDEELPANISHSISFKTLAYSKKGLFASGNDGVVRRIQFTSEGYISEVSELYSNSNSVMALSFNTIFSKLAVGLVDGSIEILSVSDNETSHQIYNSHHGNIVGTDVLFPGTGVICTVRQDGTIQLWQNSNISEFHSQGKLISSFSLQTECCSFCTNPTCGIIFIGSEDGYLSIVDASNIKKLRLIHRERLHQNAPLAQLVVDEQGEIFVTASSDGHVYIGSAKASRKFKIFGFTHLEGSATNIDLKRLDTGTIQCVIASSKSSSSVRVTFFEISKEVIAASEQHLESHLGKLKNESINYMTWYTDSMVYGCCFTDDEVASIYVVPEATRRLTLVQLPESQNIEEQQAQTLFLKVQDSPDIYFNDCNVKLQRHSSGKIILAYGADGSVTFLNAVNKSLIGSVVCHSHSLGGVASATLALDGKFLVTSGFDGSISRFKVHLPSSLAQEVLSYQSNYNADYMNVQLDENSVLSSYEPWRDLSSAGTQRRDSGNDENDEPDYLPGVLTWKTKQEQNVYKDQDKQYASHKQELRNSIKQMRYQIKKMVDNNAKESELEMLEEFEFELDLDEQAKFTADTDVEVSKTREKISFENLSKQFLANVIKKECWDDMVVKGRSIAAFNNNLEVSNYPMRERNKEEIEELETIMKRREIEIAEVKTRQELLEVKEKEVQGEGEAEGDDEDKNDVAVTMQGSAASKLGGGNDKMYSQFDLHSREQKINQIIMLQDSIYRIKETFNKEFTSIYSRKEQEMAKIKERNARVKKIVNDISVDQIVTDPEFSMNEKPESLFTVHDNEVTVERYLTPEMKEKLEAERLAEEDRKRRERMDNWRERGLDYMMGGVLEVKREDELKKDIPKPAFMLNKTEEEWTEDEKKAALEYERRVQDLNEEREKYRRQLDAELKKLNALTDENMLSFDEELNKLFAKKIRTQSAVVQEELKIYRLRVSLLADEEFGTWESQLRHLESCRRSQVDRLLPMIEQAKKLVKLQDDSIQNSKTEMDLYEKNISSFKKEFPDVTAAVVEQLFKLYKKKMPISQKMKAGSNLNVESPFNPYTNRPSTALRNDTQRRTVDSQMRELDHERNRPEGVELHSWEHFCMLRREKRYKEVYLNEMTLALSEFQAFVTARETELQRAMSDADNLSSQLQRLIHDRSVFIHNLDVQLLLRQGQVEVEPRDGFIHDFRDSILLHRGVIEDLNSKIKSLGEAKVYYMTDAKDSKKTFRRLEWELQVMRMEAEDLIQQMKDVNCFKISREIQRYLASSDYDGLIANEIQKLDQAIVLMQKHHEKMIQMKQGKLKELTETKSGIMNSKNSNLDSELNELNVSVNERINIDSVNAEKRDEAFAAQQRYRQILQRQRLVDLAKSQAKEVAVLRAEVERLRMRTFPALVHNQ